MGITASQVKELRDMTGAGMMDCKKALTETDGDIDKAVDWLRENGIAKSAKKAGRIAAEGLSRVAVEGKTAVVFEVNSETDFVAKNEQFLELLDKIQKALFASKPSNMDEALKAECDGETLEALITNATATIGEKITLRRFEIVEAKDDETFGCYMHNGGKISALSIMKGGDEAFAKNIAMQIASMAPEFVSREDMPSEYVEHERSVQSEIMKNDESLAGKPEKVLAGILEGKISKALQDVCLIEQVYFLDPKKKVKAELKENNAECVKFVRYVVGEGIEKRQENFAEEVAAQMK